MAYGEHIQPHQARIASIGIERAAALGLGLAGCRFVIVPNAAAHTESRPTPETLWTAWQFDPVLLTGLLLMGWLYFRGTAELWRRAGAGRGVRRWQVAVFIGALLSLSLARFSPLDALGGALFAAHMVQHLLLFLIAPVLLAASGLFLPMMWAIPATWRGALNRWWRSRPALGVIWRAVNHWAVILLLYGSVLWIWHVPALYDAALESQAMHGVEHAMFVGVAFLFWSSALDAARPGGIGHGPALLMMFVTALHSGALGALLTFADVPLYAGHERYTGAWGYTPLEDQQLAGVLMWVPMGMWFAATGLILVGLWIRAADQSVRRWESGGAIPVPEPAPYRGNAVDT